MQAALDRGAKRVFAGTRQPLANVADRATPVTLDVTDLAATVGELDILINDAGIGLYDKLDDPAVLEQKSRPSRSSRCRSRSERSWPTTG